MRRNVLFERALLPDDHTTGLEGLPARILMPVASDLIIEDAANNRGGWGETFLWSCMNRAVVYKAFEQRGLGEIDDSLRLPPEVDKIDIDHYVPFFTRPGVAKEEIGQLSRQIHCAVAPDELHDLGMLYPVRLLEVHEVETTIEQQLATGAFPSLDAIEPA